jgi:pimeloyl-ACP methyl ester carboxylesterase
VRRVLGVATGCALFLSALFACSASAVDYAPVDAPGPPLSVPQALLDASLACSGSLAGAPSAPVLLVHGTGSNPHSNFSWNYEPALTNLGIPWCTVALPGNGLLDVQDAGEYVVNAIRTMYAQAGQRISIVGHSQGGMLPRWALRFWPDTRAMVDDQIGMAPSNHGTTGAQLLCSLSCSAAAWQQSDTSEFIKALNSFQETFAGISYTEIYSHLDEVVTPNSDDTGSSALHTGDGQITNVAIQDLCPLDPSEHLAIGTQDLVAYDLAIDALTHPGPADPARAAANDPGICTPLKLMPGINPITYPANLASGAADLVLNTASAPPSRSEPPLKCYVFADCAASPGRIFSQAGATPKRAKKCKAKRKRAKRAETSKRKSCKKKHRR